MKKRRSLAALLQVVEKAGADDSRALAHFELAVFHDNNGREAEAVPQYEAAIGLGLDKKRNAKALAWLASSLYKTGRPHDAMVWSSACLEEVVRSEAHLFLIVIAYNLV